MAKLYVIENPRKLMGKTISYTDLLKTSNEKMVITTNDGGILICSFELNPSMMCEDDEELIVTPLRECQVEAELFNHTYLQKRLIHDKAFTQDELNEFMSNQIAKRKEENEKYQKVKEERERKEFERLKAKFDHANVKEG